MEEATGEDEDTKAVREAFEVAAIKAFPILGMPPLAMGWDGTRYEHPLVNNMWVGYFMGHLNGLKYQVELYEEATE